MIFKINEQNPQERLVDKVIAILKDGGVIAYPTDTCYGIGCDITNKKAIEKVYKIKGQDKKKPFSFICSDLKNISQYANVSNYAYRLMKKRLPGCYTYRTCQSVSKRVSHQYVSRDSQHEGVAENRTRWRQIAPHRYSARWY